MLSRDTLKLALLCLLGFTVFCLVVLEFTLNNRSLTVNFSKYSQKFNNLLHPVFARASNASSPTTIAPSLSKSSQDLSSSSSITFRKGTEALTSRSKPVPSLPPVDHCKGYEQLRAAVAKPSISFNRTAQISPNGTRPYSCHGCFNSEFQPLLVNCRVCNTGGEGLSQDVHLVMVILTTHKAVDKRMAIRDTWASVTRNNTAHVRHGFLLGRVQAEEDMKRVREEHERYGDIIMYDFMDSYANLTLKTLTAMHWAIRLCNNSRFLLKVDDDMWMNIPALLETTKRENVTLHTAVGGACRPVASPIRSSHSKWYASYKAYPQKRYPGFCSGTSYVTSLNVARHVISVSPDVPFFYLEDVYVSLCIQRLGDPFRLHRLKGFFHGGGGTCVLRSPETISVHQVPPNRLRQIWNAKC